MKKSTKALLTALCAVLLVVTSVMGTIAYLTDDEGVVNTFSVGDVAIKLDEADIENEGERTEVGNEYHLIPGSKYVKDPTVTVLEDSEEAYIRMIVTVENYTELTAAFPSTKEAYKDWYVDNVLLIQYLVEGWDNAIWTSTGVVAIDATNDTATYEFRYYKTVAAPGADVELEPLFTNIVVPGTVNNAELANLAAVEINVEAHAIQAAGFDDAADAWDNF